jgi:hydrogenase maturation protease
MANRGMKKILIIGYGNLLRSDDGAGQKVAEAFFGHDELEAIATHQLTPELAETIDQFEEVYFVDAAPIQTLEIQRLTTQSNDLEFGHFVDPKTLLHLTQILYQHDPKAYLVLIPGINFDLGETFSSLTQIGITEAIDRLQNVFFYNADSLSNLNNNLNKQVVPCMK